MDKQMELRLIDADDALKKVKKLQETDPAIIGKKQFAEGYFTGLDELEIILCAIPTVDAVEVVRCKDCKHFIQEEHGCNHFGYYSHTPWVDEVDFCAYGERKDNG